jgi:hypothetical protein
MALSAVPLYLIRFQILRSYVKKSACTMRLRMRCIALSVARCIRFDGESKGSIGKIGGFTVRLKSDRHGAVLSIRSGRSR